jgi:hypothetical protein
MHWVTLVHDRAIPHDWRETVIEKGTLVTFPLGFEGRAIGTIEHGPYEASDEFKKEQLDNFSIEVKSVYDIRSQSGNKVTIAAQFVRRA